MEKEGYGKAFSAAVTAASSIIGPIIPPSVIMVIYAHVMGCSVAALFLAGIVPGVLMGLLLMVFNGFISHRRNYEKKPDKPSAKKVLRSFIASVPALMAPVIILGGILAGICTPTEAAALAVLYVFIMGVFVFRTLKLKDIAPMLLNCTLLTSVIFLIMGTAAQIGYLISDIHLPQNLAEFMMSVTSNRYLLLFMINIFLLLMGMIMEIVPNVVLLGPILAPMAISMGVHPIHFAMILLVNVNVGMITPPMGEILFVASSVGNVKLEKVVHEVWPFIGAEILVIFLITYFPSLTLWIPTTLGFVK